MVHFSLGNSQLHSFNKPRSAVVQVSSPAKAAAVQRAAISGGRCAIDGLELNC